MKSKIVLTPAVLELTYNLLKTVEPYKHWRLPASDEVVFRVVRQVGKSPDIQGQHLSPRQTKNHPHPGHHVIDVNERRVNYLSSLIWIMAHEMCHVKEAQEHPYSGEAHGENYHRYARLACAHLGYDPGTF